VAMRPPTGMPKLSRRSRVLLILGVAVLVILIAGARLLGTYVNWLWYGEVGHRAVFSTILLSRLALWAAVTVFVGGLLSLNLWMAHRTRPIFVPVSGPDEPLARYRTAVAARPKLFGLAIPAVVGIIAGLAAQSDWQTLQLFLHATPFHIADPVFGHDIGFYTFQLPFYRLLLNWGYVAVAIGFVGSLVAHYVFGGIRLAGRTGQLSASARVQLAVLAGIFVLLKAVGYFFDRYDLLLSQRDRPLFTGATFTDLNALMPAKLILVFIAVFCAFAFFAAVFLRNLQIPALATVLLVLSSVLIGSVWPMLLEQFSVKPNANVREALSIQRNIAATKQAFGITDNKIQTVNYPGNTDLTASQVATDQGTIPNVRLLDPNVLSATFTQLTQQLNFYGFPKNLSIDRYPGPGGKLQDYLVAAREINPNGLAANQQSWINRHMEYTHGNGFVDAPANQVNSSGQNPTGGGYPQFSISDVANHGQGRIPVTQPRIYYGLLDQDYAIVGQNPGQQPREYDTDTQRFTYTGQGGVPIGSWFNRLAFAAYYGEWNIWWNRDIGTNSKIIYNRNPRDRVHQVAPWLHVDSDPYPAVIDGRIQWIVDGYTTLDNFPYSQLTQFGAATSDTVQGIPRQPNENINYIRNSVKATVDAYDGTVTLYSVDDNDPVLKAWEGVFPGVVKPSSAISPQLQAHFRYPEDLFMLQRSLLGQYHVTNPAEFYSAQSFWEVPPDPTSGGQGGNNSGGNQQPPYYIVAEAPGQRRPTFQLTSALTAYQRPNLAAWVSVSSDPQDYGKFTVLTLPTQTQTLGPYQVQQQMEATPSVTESRSLFNNPAVRPLFGNLLTLPVDGGLLYIEPLYIQPTNENSSPQLTRVLVFYAGKVGFDDTLGGALDQVFGPGADQAANQTQQGAPPAGPVPSPPSTPAAPPGGNSPALTQAIAAIRAALDHIKAAQQSGNFADLGAAYQQLDNATRQFEQQQGG
jgi:uncharacterized protein